MREGEKKRSETGKAQKKKKKRDEDGKHQHKPFPNAISLSHLRTKAIHSLGHGLHGRRVLVRVHLEKKKMERDGESEEEEEGRATSFWRKKSSRGFFAHGFVCSHEEYKINFKQEKKKQRKEKKNPKKRPGGSPCSLSQNTLTQ